MVGAFCSMYVILDNKKKICNSADEYVFPVLNINNSSTNVRLILLLLSHLLKFPIRLLNLLNVSMKRDNIRGSMEHFFIF